MSTSCTNFNACSFHKETEMYKSLLINSLYNSVRFVFSLLLAITLCRLGRVSDEVKILFSVQRTVLSAILESIKCYCCKTVSRESREKKTKCV
jgi:hypothetical protein